MRESVIEQWFRAKRGRVKRLSRELGITPSAISQWDQVPINHVLRVAKITRISRSKLRPDIYPSKDEAAS